MTYRKDQTERPGQGVGQQLRRPLLAGLFLAVCLVGGGVHSTLRASSSHAAVGGESREGLLASARAWRLGSRTASLVGGYPSQTAALRVQQSALDSTGEGQDLGDFVGGEGRGHFAREKLPFTPDESVQQQRPQQHSAAAAAGRRGWGRVAQLLARGGWEGEAASAASDAALLAGGEASARVARRQLPFAEDWEGGGGDGPGSSSGGRSGSSGSSSGDSSEGGVWHVDSSGGGSEEERSREGGPGSRGYEGLQSSSESAGSAAGACRRLLWFTALGEGSSQDTELYLKAALVSARQHAPSLIPVLLYGGPEPSNLTRLFSDGSGTSLRHQLHFPSTLLAVNDSTWRDRLAEDQAYFWLDIPQVMERIQQEGLLDLANASTQYALFTEAAVLFLGGGPGEPPGDISTCTVTLPELIAMGSEPVAGLASSTSVLLLNLTALAQELPALLRFGEENDSHSSNQTGRGASGLILEYMRALNRSVGALEERLNWKPYWGSHPQATILHWHGPKPSRDLPCFLAHHTKRDWESRCHSMPPEYLSLLREAQKIDGGKMYGRMAAKFKIYLQQAEGSPGRGPRRRRQHEQAEGGLGRK